MAQNPWSMCVSFSEPDYAALDSCIQDFLWNDILVQRTREDLGLLGRLD